MAAAAQALRSADDTKWWDAAGRCSAGEQTPSEWWQDRAARAAAKVRRRTVEVASDRCVQVTTASALGGATVAGAGGAAVGVVTGGTLGAAVGLLPALFTFGLSIPIFGLVGGAWGGALGGAAGTTAGFTVGGAAGYGAFTKRASIDSMLASLLARGRAAQQAAKGVATCVSARLRRRTVAAGRDAKARLVTVKRQAAVHLEATGRLAQELQATAVEIASAKAVQATAASAAGGAVVGGTGGAVTGLLSGVVAGGAVGVVPALFTFGLSIPFCAVVGAGVGLAAGTALGGTTGTLAGGAGGYGLFSRREAIGRKLEGATGFMQDTFQRARCRSGGTTGGTPE